MRRSPVCTKGICGPAFGMAILVIPMLLTAFSAVAEDERNIVFDRGADLLQTSPLINLRAHAAIYTIYASETKVDLPVLVPGTRDGSANMMPSWFPDRGRLAYVSNRGTDVRAQIWTVGVASGTHTQVTNNPGNNLSPAVSPDSAMIAYLSTNNIEDFPEDEETPDEELWKLPENLELYVMNVDGTEPKRLTENEVEEETPIFSFFGDLIYFVRNTDSGKAIFSIPADGEIGDELPVQDSTATPLLGSSLALLGDPLGDILCFNDAGGTYTFFDTFTLMASTGGSGFVRPYPNDDGTKVVHVPGGNLYLANATGGNAQSLVLTGDVTYAQWRAPVGAGTPAALRLDRPKGGEIWPRGTTKNIEWKFTGPTPGQVKIELSHNGLEPEVIVASTANDGVYEWAIPSDLDTGSDYIVTVTMLSDPTTFDSSDAVFRIATANDCPKPSQVRDVQASDGAYGDRVRVTWSASPNATEYIVYRNRVNSWSTATLLDTVEETGFDDTTATPATIGNGCAGPTEQRTEYFYWVRAVNDCGLATTSQPDKGYRGVDEEAASIASGDTLLLGAAVAAMFLARRKAKKSWPRRARRPRSGCGAG